MSQILSALFVLRFLTGDKAELRLTPIKDLQELPAELAGNDPDDRFRSTALDIAGLEAAAFVMQFTNSLVSIVCNSTLSKYGGEVMISVYTIINSVRQVLETPVIAIGEGTSPVISYNYGARRPGHLPLRIRRCVYGGARLQCHWRHCLYGHNAFDSAAGAEENGVNISKRCQKYQIVVPKTKCQTPTVHGVWHFLWKDSPGPVEYLRPRLP